MEIPTFKSHWSYPPRRPRYHPSEWEIPAKRSNPTSRTVNIPVRFVGSERSKSDSAVKIQKVLRGFLVRKSVKKIMAMRSEADSIEKKLQEREFVELIGTNAKERLKVNETLMHLLFKLDSVRGIDSGVRDCRKEVIKKVIALQEKVDGIVAKEKAAGVVIRTPVVDSDDAATELKVSENSEKHSAYCLGPEQQHEVSAIKSKENHDSLANGMKGADNVETLANPVKTDGTVFSEYTSRPDEMNQSQAMDHSRSEMSTETERSAIEDPVVSVNADIVNESETNEVEEVVTVNELKSSHLMDELADSEMPTEHEQSCLELGRADEILDAGTEAEFISTEVEEKWDQIPSTEAVAEEKEKTEEAESQSNCSPNLQNPIIEEEVENTTSSEKMEWSETLQPEGEEIEENNVNKQLLERMEEENERMTGLIAELLEKNETQNRLLKSLSERVEYLEKTFIREKLRKKKRRNAAAAANPSCSAKCGKKCKGGGIWGPNCKLNNL